MPHMFSLSCNRRGLLCGFAVCVLGALQNLPYKLAGIWSTADAYPIVFATFCILILIFPRMATNTVVAAVVSALCLGWMWGIINPSFPFVNTRHRFPGFSSFTFSIASFSRRTAPGCGRVINSMIPHVLSSLLPSAVVALVVLWWYSDDAVTTRVFQKNFPSVVCVSVGKPERGGTRDERSVKAGTGSGFVWDKRGHIVTNFHVIREPNGTSVAADVRVCFADKSYVAHVVGCDEEKDVAVLHVSEQAMNMIPVHVGRSVSLRVGQKVYAIGNPFGLDHTLTTGVVSGLGRDLKYRKAVIYDGIQTDASINPGSSGGPLLDSSGKLIGVNAVFLSPNGTSVGIGFSIGIDTVRGIIEQIIEKGRATRPYIGIKFSSSQSQQQHGHGGVHVHRVDSNSPAQEAGILNGDVIISFNGKRVNNGSDLYKFLDECRSGNKVKVKVLRAGETMELEVTLGIRQPTNGGMNGSHST